VGKPALLYDGGCGFCRCAAWLIAMLDRPRRLRFLPLNDPVAVALLGDMPAERQAASWHLITDEGRVHSGGEAVAPLMKLLPAGVPLAALARLLPGPTDAGYRFIARHRGSLAQVLVGRRCDPPRR
jgi:predicted DCC family thiol-disulfide oxidoreductase YuxK